MSSPSVCTYDLSENVFLSDRGSQILVRSNCGDYVLDVFELNMLPTSVNYGDDQFSCKDGLLIKKLCDVINECQFSDGNDIVDHVVSHVESLLKEVDLVVLILILILFMRILWCSIKLGIISYPMMIRLMLLIEIP